MSTALSPGQLPLAPLGAGDLIDRAIRLYRRHLFVLIRTAAPPVIVAAAGWIVFWIAFRSIFSTPDTTELFLYILLCFISFGVGMGGYLFTLVVMGGATRTLVAHLLRNEPVTARATYAAVRARFWGLFGASLLVLLWIMVSLSVVWIAVYIVMLMSMAVIFVASQIATWLTAVVGTLGVLLGLAVGVWLFFFIAGRVAYVPQVMLVEGKGVFQSFSRSFSLARGNVRRLMAMTLFTTFATYSALMVLMAPLGWYGYLSGINPLNTAQWPAWYSIAYSVLGPLSSILLTPVWMLGLSLLYVDERVRHEGYDIELMAARQLGELPDVNVSSPFGTALSSISRKQTPPAPPAPRSSGTIFNLLLLVLLLLVPSAAQAQTLNTAEYQKHLQSAIDELEWLQTIRNPEESDYYNTRIDLAIHMIEETLPEQQQVETTNGVCNVDNSWLRPELKNLREAAVEQRPAKLAQLTARLKAIEERVADTQTPATVPDDKAQTKAKLDSILARPEYTTEARGTNALTRLLQEFIKWLMDHLPHLQVKPGGARWVGMVAEVVVVLIALSVLFYVLKILLVRFRGARRKRAPKKREARIVLGEQLEPDKTAGDLLSEAEALARRGELRTAIRKAYIALLVELGDRKVIMLAQHKTNRDYLNAVRSMPVLHPTMRTMTESFERHWYGLVEATDNDWQNFRSRYQAAVQTQN